MGDGVEAVLEQRYRILGAGDEDDDAQYEELNGAARDEVPSNPFCGRVNRLIHQGGCPPEVA